MPRYLFLMFACVWLSACAVHEHRPDTTAAESVPEYKIQHVGPVRYTPDDWPEALSADVYLPAAEGRFPAVLVVHGGGWSGGERSNMKGNAQALARAGFVAVNISYRLAPANQFPDQLNDLQQAMRWIHRNAEQYKIDTARIGGFGYSAGAHLVALLGVTHADSVLDEPYGGKQTRLNAVACGGTPADLAAFGKSGRLLRQFMGGTKQQMPELYAAASPITHVNANSPPFFLYHGQWDTLVPISQSENFAARLQSAGVHAELLRLRFRGHIGAYFIDGTAIKKSIDFLQRELALPDASQSPRAGSET